MRTATRTRIRDNNMHKLNMTKVETLFAEDWHTYTIGGKLMPGVTTILDTLAKPELIPWAAKMVWGELTRKYDEVMKMSQEEYEAFILKAKGASARKSKEA